MNSRVTYCCKRFQTLSKRGLTTGKHFENGKSLSLLNAALNMECRQNWLHNYSSSASSSENVDYSRDKTTHFGYQTVSEKEKHENGKYNRLRVSVCLKNFISTTLIPDADILYIFQF